MIDYATVHGLSFRWVDSSTLYLRWITLDKRSTNSVRRDSSTVTWNVPSRPSPS